MRVLLTIRSWDIGGAQTYAVEMMREFRQLGHEVGFLAVHPGGELWGKATSGSFCSIALGQQRLSVSREPLLSLSIHPPGLLISHLYAGDLIAYAIRQSIPSVPWISVKHMLTTRVNEGNNFDEFWDCFAADDIVERVLCQKSDCIVAVSEVVARNLQTRGVPRHKILIWPTAISLRNESLSRVSEVDRLSLNLRFGCLSRLYPEKGVDVLIQACSFIRNISGWSLEIASDGPMRERLETEVRELGLEDRITFIGIVPDALEFLTHLDAVILPSRQEGHPLVIQEAASVGTPCIATGVGGVPDIAKSGGLLIIPPEKPKVLAGAMESIINDRSKITKLRRSMCNLQFGRPLGELVETIVKRFAIEH